jgi:hypothetical protein
MKRDKLGWCLKQKKGIRLTEPKQHLSEAYMKEADETLENVFSARGKWKVITAYYACYNALYSLFMRCGITCEIHDCSLELMGLFGFNASEIAYLRQLKDDRIQTQYYLKEKVLEDEAAVKRFVLMCKTILSTLSSDRIEGIRQSIRPAKKRGR